MSAFDDDADDQHENEFEENLKLFEEMLVSGQPQFFDADDIEEIIDYYLQWLNMKTSATIFICQFKAAAIEYCN